MRTVNSETLVTEWREHQILRQKHPELYGLKSLGMPELDKILGGGVEPGQYVIIGGQEKSGKTTFLVNKVAVAFARQGMRFVMLSGEMRNHQIASMLFSNLSEIERTKIRALDLSDEDWNKLDVVGDEVKQWNGYWTQGFSTIQDVFRVMEEISKQLTEPLDAILIDYIQLMSDAEAKGNRVQEILSISRKLKLITNKEDHPMIVVINSQLNRSSIRSGIVDRQAYTDAPIERDMDIGLIIHQTKDPNTGDNAEDRRRITVVGSRETGIGKVDVFFNGAIGKMEAIPNDSEDIQAVSLEQTYWLANDEM